MHELPVRNQLHRTMSDERPSRQISEIKSTCRACGNIWFYGKKEIEQNRLAQTHNAGAALSNCGKSMMCCSGCAPALFIPEASRHAVEDLDKCPKCGSAAVAKETVIHDV
jgi:predicted nucleic-acid-binding Zn-ribbon protein